MVGRRHVRRPGAAPSMRVSVASSSWRRSAVMRTCPGMTLREPGWACSSPTVPRLAGLVGVGDADHRLHQVAGRQQRASRRIGMGVGPACFHAGHDDVVPAQAQRSGDHAHDLSSCPGSALLDGASERAAHRTAAHRVRAGAADGLQFVAHRQALGVAGGQRGFQREFAGEHARAHHHRHEARAFLVGPDGDFQRRFGLYAGVVERTDHFQARQHAVAAVELAASGWVSMWLPVMTGQRVIVAGAAREDVAQLVHAHAHAGVAHPARDQVAALAVQRGQGQAAVAALGAGADPPGPSGTATPVAVDGQRGIAHGRPQGSGVEGG